MADREIAADFTLYTGRQGIEDFENAMQEHIDGQSSRRVNQGVLAQVENSAQYSNLTEEDINNAIREIAAEDSQPYRRIDPVPQEGSIRQTPEGNFEGFFNGAWTNLSGATGNDAIANADSMMINVNGTPHWYSQAEEQALREFQDSRARFEDFVVTGESVGPTNSSVVGIAEMNSLANPQHMDRCHVQENRTTYLYYDGNWVAQVNPPSLIEQMRPVQDALNDLQFKNQVEIAKGTIIKEGKFLGNIEK